MFYPVCIIEIWQHSHSLCFHLILIVLPKIGVSERNQRSKDQWIVVFKAHAVIQASLTLLIGIKQDLLSEKLGSQFHHPVCCLPCWPPPFPSTTYFSSEKQLPSITRLNSIQVEIVLKVLMPSASGVDSSSVWERTCEGCDEHLSGFWPLSQLKAFKLIDFLPSLSPLLSAPPLLFPFLSLSSITQNGNDCADQNPRPSLFCKYWKIIWEPLLVSQMLMIQPYL